MASPNLQLAAALAALTAGRTTEAMLAIHQLAARNDADAQVTLGKLKWAGSVIPQDLPGARVLFGRAGVAGHGAAALWHTNLLGCGVAGPRDWPAAIKQLRAEAKRDPARSKALAIVETMDLTVDGDPSTPPQGQSLSTAPEVTLFPGLLTAAECSYLMQVAEPGYGPSVVNDSAGRQVRDPIRTSDASTFAWLIEDPAIHAINRRLAVASGSAFDQGEALQLLRYRPGQQYRPHYDFVRASDNQRVLTALAYLNDNYQGGETAFVKTGLSVKGKRGDVLVFRNALPDRSVDPLSEHCGMPVTKGTKYLASRWIRERRWLP